jgi:hypothetical protein
VTSPDDAKALLVGHAMLALVEALGIGSTGAPMVYTQDSLPPDARSKSAYLEVHREHVKAGVPGWTRAGQVRAVERAAWSTYVDEQTKRTRRRKVVAVPAANDAAPRDISAELDAKLGIRVHGRGAR